MAETCNNRDIVTHMITVFLAEEFLEGQRKASRVSPLLE